MEFLLIIPFLSAFVAAMIFVVTGVKPYLDGTKQIDHIKYPTLARAQRIHRYKNVKAREVEFFRKETVFSAKIEAIEAATDAAIAERRQQSTADEEFNAWDVEFSDITRERDEAARREAARVAAEEKAKRDAAAAELRERELAVWTAQEKVRIAQFMADQKAAQELEQQQAAELMRSRENDIQALRKYYVPDHENQSFGYRIVSVHGLYVRKLPVKASRVVDNLGTGAMLSVNGWITGEELYGNPIWFKLANDAGWVWSGGVDNKSTSGLMNYCFMNEPGDSFTQKDAFGQTVMSYTAPSEMKTLIDAEIKAMEREKAAIERKLQASKHPFGTLNAGMITSTHIDAGQLNVSSAGMSVTQNGMTVAEFDRYKKSRKDWFAASLASRGGLAAPVETQYNIFSDNGRKANFWRGTEFENM